jgi:fumarylacetoacetate (FAA) hydrolase
MKLVTLIAADRSLHIGALITNLPYGQNLILDFYEIEKSSNHQDMVEFIRNQKTTLPWAKEQIALAQNNKMPAHCIVKESEVTLTAPVPKPVSCRDGYAFRQHVESARKGRGLPMIPEFDLFPTFYFTNHLAIVGPGEVFVMEKALERLDFELEVAIVTGKEGRNIPASKADDYIFGYMIMNDWSAREFQTQEMKLNLGPAKGKDFATGLGPYLVTKDELEKNRIPGSNGDRYDLRMTAFHNGKQVSDGNLKDMNWTFAQILERVSYGVTVHPGEVIGSGTVGTGCYMELNLSKITDNVWIHPDDQFALEVDGLGRLENTIRKANS